MTTNGTTADDADKDETTLCGKVAFMGDFRGKHASIAGCDDAHTHGANNQQAANLPDRARGLDVASNDTLAQHLPAAMGYCARRILEALDDTGDAGAQAAFAALTPATRELLTWWFGRDASRRRRRNFNCGQREAILHTVLAHELFGSDDPQWLFRAACSAWPSNERSTKPHLQIREADKALASESIAMQPGYAAYCLRMAPGAGGRWVLQALMVWQWAGDIAARAHGISDERFSDAGFSDARFDTRFALLVPDRALARRFEAALFGPRSASHTFDIGRSSLLRHADVFLPPHLREAFAQWLTFCADDGANDSADGHRHGALRIGVLDDARGSHDLGTRTSASSPKRATPIRLLVGDGAAVLAEGHDVSTLQTARIATAYDKASFCDLAQRRRLRPHAAQSAAPHLLWIELDSGHEYPPPDAAALADLPLARALRIGAVKSLLLADVGVPMAARRRNAAKPSPHRGLRPVLPRCERPAINAGLELLERVERETRSLRLHLLMDAAPALLVLCEDLALRRAVAAYARTHGFAREAIVICDTDNADPQAHASIVIDALPARHAAMQSRFCAVVLLRSGDAATTVASDLGELLWPALAPHWHDPALAESKAENRERIGSGRVPCDLIDVLTAIATIWPTQMRESSREGQALLRIGIEALPQPCGDLLVTEPRSEAHDVDIVLPDTSAFAQSTPLRWLSQQPRRLLRARQSLPVRKCVYHHQGWSAHSSGLERGLIEMADADPHVAAFCVFDTQRQPWPQFDSDSDQDHHLTAQPPCPNALVRTPGYVYVVQFAPYLPNVPDSAPPNRAASSSAPSASSRAGRETLAGWCRRVNALPADRRQFREWRSVQVQAPLFWSWKRRGGTLSSLLSALADTTPIAIPISASPSARPPH
jgi:hypothetical protein